MENGVFMHCVYLILFKKLCLFFLCSLCMCMPRLVTCESTYAIAYKHSSDAHTDFHLYGMRCSGTNYTTHLLRQNFPERDVCFDISWKHFPPWVHVDGVNYLEENGQKFLSMQKKYLFIVVVRNPFDWVRSFRVNPYHISRRVDRSSLSSFIHAPWYFDRCPDDQHPNGGCFKNVIALRTARLKNILSMCDLMDNFYMVRYETIRDHPEEVLREIASLFSISMEETFVPFTRMVRGRTGVTEKPFSVTKYDPVSEEDRAFILRYLDPDLERFLGYEL